MRFTYFTKAIFAGTVTFLGAVNVLLVGDATFGDFTQGQWVGLVLATVVVVGGVLGLQEAPSSVATSTRP